MEMIILLTLWHIFGFIICGSWAGSISTDGWELCNPYWSYKYHYSVNWFGAIIISLVYTILCPIAALIYWFYKLCTIGRK